MEEEGQPEFLGKSVTPFGPPWLDRMISNLFLLKGDFVPDFRLIDYLVVLMSTDQSPALDGELNNSRPLKEDLADLGVFDTKMSLYLFEKLREYGTMGFSGFEGRHYSLFESFTRGHGAGGGAPESPLSPGLQIYRISGRSYHDQIPDDPIC